MFLFTKITANEVAEIRGLPDADLPKLTDQQLIMLSLARLFEGIGIEDEALIQELYRRGRGNLLDGRKWEEIPE